jgi:hypothetical protein
VADYEWLYIAATASAIAIALVLLYATRIRRNKEKAPPETPVVVEARESWLTRALRTERTVTPEEATKAKDELKMLDLEREILSFAIRRLYEAQAEGKINEEERERLASHYKSRMMQVRDTIARSESVVALHELEAMQQDLVKLFSDRFDELGKKVEELRTQLQLKATEEEEETPVPTEPTLESAAEAEVEPEEKEKKKPRKKPTPSPSGKSDAEKRIDEIKAEVEKVLERLGDIEVEGEN